LSPTAGANLASGSAEPLEQFLQRPDVAQAPWAAFDADWYCRTYPNEAEDSSAAEARARYFAQEQQAGRSPNMFFDERWYVARYPELNAALQTRRWHSGFDHYCRAGYVERSPHWLYDDAFFLSRNPDLTDAAVRRNGCVNRYDHYIRFGAREGRVAHLLFDPSVWRMWAARHDEADTVERFGPFAHFLRHTWQHRQSLPTSVYFDPAWYLSAYNQAVLAIAAGEFLCALHHYLANATPVCFDPLQDFSEVYYLSAQPMVAELVQAGVFRCSYEHFLLHGVFDLKAPASGVALDCYQATHPTVAADLASGRFRDVFEHRIRVNAKPAGAGGSAPVSR
jgi:O-antigen biosynthesis protein